MESFHIPRKKNFPSSPAVDDSTAAAASAASSQSKDMSSDVPGDSVMTPDKPKSSNVYSSPDKSPGGRQILRRGDLVHLSNEQKSGRIQGGLARIARIHYPEGDAAHNSTSEPLYDIEYILGGKVSNVQRDHLEYTTATAEGLIDTGDGTRGLRRSRSKRVEEELKMKDEGKTAKKQKDKTSKRQIQNNTTDGAPIIKRKRGRPPKNPKKANVEAEALNPSSNRYFERPPTSRQLANMEKEGEKLAESPQPKKKKKTVAAVFDRVPTSRQISNMENAVVETTEYLQPIKKSGKGNAAGKRKITKSSKESLRRSSSRATDTSESGVDTSEEYNETRRNILYTKHRNEMEKAIQRLQKMDRYGFFLEPPPSDLDENYDDALNTENSDDESDSDGEMKTKVRKTVSFPDQPPYNFLVLKKRFNAGRYDLDMVEVELERRSKIKLMLGPEPSSAESENAAITSALEDNDNADKDDYQEVSKIMLHPLAVDWDTLKCDVFAMCDAAMVRDPDGASLGTGHLGFSAKKVKELMGEIYNSTGVKRTLEVEESETRHKYGKVLINCGNKEAAMQGKWRKAAFPERKYQRLETASVICDGLSKEDKSYAMYELQTTLPDSFVGLAYMYDDAGQQSETWMKTVADETSKAKKSRKKKKSSDDNDISAADKEKEKAAEAAKALAKDDGVTRAQLETTMHTLKIQVQDRVMTDLGVMYQAEARSANWNDGDKERNYNGGDAEVEQGGTANNDKDLSHKWDDSIAEVAEQEVWGVDCYTRKNVMVIIEAEFSPEIAAEFVEKWLPPAINACPVNLAHNMSMAARILEGLPLPDDEEHRLLSKASEVSDINSDMVEIDRSATNTPDINGCHLPVAESSDDHRTIVLGGAPAEASKSHHLPLKNENSVFLRKALEEKIANFGPPWLKAAARLIRLTVDSMDDDYFRIHPKGHGSVVIAEEGLKANSLVTYYRGEVYPAWRWCEKLDAIEHVQKELGLRPNLPDFYNMAMERPMKDPRGYSLLFVDASRKSGLGSSFSHSCSPTCEVRVVALNGKLSLAMTTLRDLEVGEELTFDYNAVTESLNEYRFAICLCGHRNCRGSFLHFATADCYQQVLSRNSPIAARFANLVRGCMKQVMSKEDSELLSKHGFCTAAFGAVSFNHHTVSADSNSTQDSIENVPIWLRTFVADCLRYIEYERKALPVALLCNQMDRIEKSKKEAKKKLKPKPVPKKEKSVPADKPRSISGSRPKTSWMYFLECKRDHYKTVVQKKHPSLKGLEFAQEVSREVSKAFKKLSEEKKEAWKKKAIAEWKKNGGEEKAKQEEKRQKALGKRAPVDTVETDNTEASAPNETESSFEVKTISFADADAEGCSAMEQRIQQLAQSLSRVGRVLDRHRENVFSKNADPNTQVNSKVLRDFVPTPLKIMSDKDLVDWIWENPKGIIKSLFTLVEENFPKDTLLRNILFATKVKYNLRLTNKNTFDAKTVSKEALLQFRKNILDFLAFADESLDEKRKEKNREKDRLRRKKALQQNNTAATSSEQRSDDMADDSSQIVSHEDAPPKESSFFSSSQSGEVNYGSLNEEDSGAVEKDDNRHSDTGKLQSLTDVVMHIRGGGDFPDASQSSQHSAENVGQASGSKPPTSEVAPQTLPFQSNELMPDQNNSSNSPGLGLLTKALTTVGLLKATKKPSFVDESTEDGRERSSEDCALQRSSDQPTEKVASSTTFTVGMKILPTNDVSGKNTEMESTVKSSSCAAADETYGVHNKSRDVSESVATPSMDLLLSATKQVLPEHTLSVQVPVDTLPAQNSSSQPKKKAPPMSQEKVAYLRNWIIEHAANPYPTPEEKETMIAYLKIERKRLDSWLVRNRRAILGGDREIKMKWSEKTHEHWSGFHKKRYMLESTADLLLMYANTTTFFMLEPFCRFKSTAIEVYARELGNDVPLGFALNSSHPAIPAQPKHEQPRGGMVGTRREEEEEQEEKKQNDPATISATSPEEAFCSPDDVIDNVTVDYSGDYVLSQLLQWVNGGIGQAKGLPECYGCVTLPPLSGCWEEVDCDEVKLPNYTRYNKAKATEYAAKIRPKLAEWFLNRYQRGSPWDEDLAKFFCSAESRVPDPTMPMGSPIIDYLITGMEENIRKISAALKGKDEESEEGKSKRSKLSTSDRLQSTVDEGMPAQAVANWVQCEDPKCLKWRKLPWHVDVDLLPDKFYCKDNVWNPTRQTCDAEEDDWDMDDAPIKFDSNLNFEVGAWFDVQRDGKVGYSEAQVVELDLDSTVKRVKFTFYRLKSDRDEWVEVGSPRIAPHHSYTPRPFTGTSSTKKEDTSGAKRKMDDVKSEDVTAQPLKLSSENINYLNNWLNLHTANISPNSFERAKIMADTGLSESQLDEWLRLRKKTKKKKVKNDGLTDEQREEKEREKELKKKMNDEINSVLGSWLLRPENMLSNPIQAATPSGEVKDSLAKQLGVDRTRIDSWFYRRRKKLKKALGQSGASDPSSQSMSAVGGIPQVQPQPQLQSQPHPQPQPPQPQPQPQTQVKLVGAPAKPPVHLQNPNLNLPSQHQRPQNQTPLTISTQVSMSVNQRLPSSVQSHAVGGDGNSVQSSYNGANFPKQVGLSHDAKEYLTQWLLKTANPYPSKDLKDKIMAHFGIENTRTLDGFLTRTRKKLNLQNKQASTQIIHQHSVLASNAIGRVASQVAAGSSNIHPQQPTPKPPQPNQTSSIVPTSTSTQIAAARNFQPTSVIVPVRDSKNLKPSFHSTIHPGSSSQMIQSKVVLHPQPSKDVSAQTNSSQIAAVKNSQPAPGAPPMHTSNLDSLLTAVEMVNNRTNQNAPNQIGQKHFSTTATETSPNNLSQFRPTNIEQEHHQQQTQQQLQYQNRQQQPPPPQQQLHRFSHPVHNGEAHNSGQQGNYSASLNEVQNRPVQMREQSILLAYQNLQQVEIQNRLSRRSSPSDADVTQAQHSMQNNDERYSQQHNVTTSATADGEGTHR